MIESISRELLTPQISDLEISISSTPTCIVDFTKLLTDPAVVISPEEKIVSRDDESSFQQALKSFTIMDGIKGEYTENGKKFEGMWFILESGRDVGFSPPQHRLPLIPPLPLSPSFEQALDNRQSRKRPKIVRERIHEKNILFFMANWDKLAPYFYDEWPENCPPLKRYSEIVLNDFAVNIGRDNPYFLSCGAIDFMGMGPDNQMILIEFNNKGGRKEKQIAKQTRGLERLMAIHGNSVPIKAYKGIFTPTGKVTLISFQEPQFSRISHVGPRTIQHKWGEAA